MEVIKIDTIYDVKKTEDTILVLGYFDGLHRGHKALFDEAKKLSQILNLKISVLTFPESPKLAFTKFKPDLLKHLSTTEDRLKKFEEYGVDSLYLTDFTSKFAHTKADDFIRNYIEDLGAKVVVTGFDYTFGNERMGAEYLRKNFSGKVVTVPAVREPLEYGENEELTDKISSSRIRDAIDKGNIKLANNLLGYNFMIEGIVVHGDARGRTLGFPTANLVLTDNVHLPDDGVYVVDVNYDGKTYRGMASVGKNVTFDGTELRLEVNILDFSGDIYGEKLELIWLDRIRDMVKFDSIEMLVEQLKDDEEKARKWVK
ncbi:riboflavin biosynthesis protein RibF [Floricoccus tropicus]|uniref:Riboflavin biosynthesis protein n=1 Tax=Floricoccus tropicus TaxID=1859473 RepID=A0A1E8GNS3_9LACT|nr:bifunctional riboflavin kinase/FAD synthetase [Floricoccus tropicus]OFI49656.1 riboflavin biosynthesis protein RibF [Floricoccus tropicus]